MKINWIKWKSELFHAYLNNDKYVTFCGKDIPIGMEFVNITLVCSGIVVDQESQKCSKCKVLMFEHE